MSQINEIIIKAKQGNVESMEYILKFFKPKVIAICREYFLLGADFDDLNQEGMIGLYKAINGFDENRSDSFAHFASMCIHRQIQNAVKIANSKKNLPLNDYISISVDGGFSENGDEPKIILPAKDKGVEQLSIDKETENNLHQNLKQLLTKEQYGILLMYLNGYSYNEIASNYNISSKKVDNNIQSIKRKLRGLLKGD
ncbi:MAG: sigma-70 family RNA polymerase sigma factor [Clostridia bacterium]